MQCIYCGGFVEPRHKFCLSCGRSIKDHKNGDTSIHPKPQATMSFKCPECSSKLVYNKKVFRFWCETCKANRYPDPNFYDIDSLKISKNLHDHLGVQTLTDIQCPVCSSRTHFDTIFGTYWCDYCNKYTRFHTQKNYQNQSGDYNFNGKLG
jgi:DNA-directed RNA polymerase subunit RPC12/RpoP